MSNVPLRWLYWKTGIVCAITALVVALRVDFAWAASFASASLFGLANWFLLGLALVALVEKRKGMALLWASLKFPLILTYVFVVLGSTGITISAFFLGFSAFLLVAALQAVGGVFVDWQRRHPGERALPGENLRAMFLGTAKDA